MNVSVLGGGAWGTTLAQVLADNNNQVLIRDINEEFVKKININHFHPFFDLEINYMRMYTFNATAERSAPSLKCCFYFSFKGINFLYHSYDK